MKIIKPDKPECCSNCLYSEFARGVLFCNNSDSDLYLDDVNYHTSCEYWIDANEERKRK
jgi:hypothetical protein